MGTFTTKLKLGGKAYGVNGGIDPYITNLTVGQVRVVQTHPKGVYFESDGCYKEEYMCFETGVGSGTIWKYGKNIFATEAEAQHSVIEHQQAAHKERAQRVEDLAAHEARRRDEELATLKRLQAKYELG